MKEKIPGQPGQFKSDEGVAIFAILSWSLNYSKMRTDDLSILKLIAKLELDNCNFSASKKDLKCTF